MRTAPLISNTTGSPSGTESPRKTVYPVAAIALTATKQPVSPAVIIIILFFIIYPLPNPAALAVPSWCCQFRLFFHF
jgi:hypothetical protein